MAYTDTYFDDYADDFYVTYDDAGALTTLDDSDVNSFAGYSSFFDFVEAHAVYADVADRAYDAARKADDRALDHAARYDEALRLRERRAADTGYREADNARRAAAHAAERAADLDGVRERTRQRVAAHRARKRAERLAQKG